MAEAGRGRRWTRRAAIVGGGAALVGGAAVLAARKSDQGGAPDDAWLSPFYQRESGSIAVHAYYREDHDFFFTIVEPIFRRHGGRPHWGKLHSLKARDLAALYPRWKEAGEVRRALDPDGRMLNDYLKGIFRDG